jgi:hypothetical protein
MRLPRGCLLLSLGLAGCAAPDGAGDTAGVESALLARYATIPVEVELDVLTDAEREMLPLLVDASRALDEAFWFQAWGDRAVLLDRIDDPAARRYAEINYGPWDRLDGDRPFLPGYGAKPAGANLYPADLSREVLEDAARTDPALTAPCTLWRSPRPS